VLGAKNVKLRTDARGRLDLDELRAYLKTGRNAEAVAGAERSK